jgi:hypothetical protein
VADLLLDKGIAHRLKPVGDVNALGMVDWVAARFD